MTKNRTATAPVITSALIALAALLLIVGILVGHQDIGTHILGPAIHGIGTVFAWLGNGIGSAARYLASLV